MSLDFTAYFASKPKRLPKTSKGQAWILNVEEPARIEPEDVPLGVRALLGRCRWQVEIHLEGELPAAATDALRATIANLVTVSLGVVDEQREIIVQEQGERPVPNIQPPPDQATGYSLQIFFEGANEFTRDNMRRVLKVIEAEMPEALPHRYGLWEPLQHRWDNDGPAGFLELWTRHEPPFWKGKSPVTDACCSFDYRVRDLGFRSGRVAIDFRPGLATDPAKLLAALRLGQQLALATNAFYTALVPASVAQGPFWKGLAPAEHLLLALGEPLLSLWPEFRRIGLPLGDSHFEASPLSGVARITPPDRLCYSAADPSDRSAFLGLAYATDFPFPKSDPYQPEQPALVRN